MTSDLVRSDPWFPALSLPGHHDLLFAVGEAHVLGLRG